MLQVKIQYNEGNERLFYINDILDVKRVMDNILEDFQRVLAQDMMENNITIERMLDNSPFDTLDELAEFVEDFECWDNWRELGDMKHEMDERQIDTVEELIDQNDRFRAAIDIIYEEANCVR